MKSAIRTECCRLLSAFVCISLAFCAGCGGGASSGGSPGGGNSGGGGSGPVQAPPGYSVVYNFDRTSFSGPAVLMASDGSFYGPAYSSSGGVVFEVTPEGSLSVLQSFSCEGSATALTPGTDGNLYGAASWGGFNCGPGLQSELFKVAPGGAFTVLGNLGVNPAGPPVEGADGNFYGCTEIPNPNPPNPPTYGTIYRFTPSGQVSTIFQFDTTTGQACNGPLLAENNTTFYSWTLLGDIFEVTTSGQFTELYNCPTNSNNCLIDVIRGTDGNYYGFAGGYDNSCFNDWCGTVSRVTPSGNYSVLYAFDGRHGSYPTSLIQGADGNFYGTAEYGGTSNDNGGCQVGAGCGVIFKLTPTGDYTILYSFDGSEGGNPVNLAQDRDGNFYGTTSLVIFRYGVN